MIDEKAMAAAIEATRRAGQRGDLTSSPVSRVVMEAAILAYESAKPKDADGLKLFGLKVVVDETLPPDVIEIRGRAANGDVHRVYAMLSAAGDKE